MIDNHFRVLHEDRHLAIVTQLELRQSNKELRLRINEVLKEYLVLLDAILKEGIENGNLTNALIFDLHVKWYLAQLMKQLLHG